MRDIKQFFGDDHDLVGVAEEFQGDYHWSEVQVFFSPSKQRFFWLADSGESEDSWGWDHTASDFKNGLKDDVLRDLKANGYEVAWNKIRAFRYNK